MKKLFTIISLILLFIACSQEKVKTPEPAYILENLISYPYQPPTELIEAVQTENLQIVGSPKTVRPDQIELYLGQSGEEYLIYHNVGLTSIIYQSGKVKLFVEIAEFASAEYAYGFYARLRPIEVKLDAIGAESFVSGLTRYAVKDNYVLTISTDAEEKAVIAEQVCRDMIATIPGGNSLPPRFMLFPYFGQIKSSLNFTPYEFEKIKGINQVYSAVVVNQNDSLHLFLAMDEDSLKFDKMTEYAKKYKMVRPDEIFHISFQDFVVFEHPKLGLVVAARIRGKLVGVIGYNQLTNFRFINNWFSGLK